MYIYIYLYIFKTLFFFLWISTGVEIRYFENTTFLPQLIHTMYKFLFDLQRTFVSSIMKYNFNALFTDKKKDAIRIKQK